MKVGRLLDIGIWNIQAHLGSIMIGLTMGIIIWQIGFFLMCLMVILQIVEVAKVTALQNLIPLAFITILLPMTSITPTPLLFLVLLRIQVRLYCWVDIYYIDLLLIGLMGILKIVATTTQLDLKNLTLLLFPPIFLLKNTSLLASFLTQLLKVSFFITQATAHSNQNENSKGVVIDIKLIYHLKRGFYFCESYHALRGKWTVVSVDSKILPVYIIGWCTDTESFINGNICILECITDI